MSDFQLNRHQNAIVVGVLTLPTVAKEATILQFRRGPDSRLVGTVELAERTPPDVLTGVRLTVLFTLPPTAGRPILVTVTDGSPQDVGDALCVVQEAVEERDLGVGDCIQMGHEYLNQNGRTAVVLGPLSLSSALSCGDSLVVAGAEARSMLVVFLSAAEYAVKTSAGLEALADYLEESDKDYIAIRSVS